MTYPPRLLQAKAAAAYLGMSETKLRGLNLPCKVDGGNKVFDRSDLDAYADALPYADKGEAKCDEADRAFKVAS